jgi:hypothetical protein
MPLTPPKLSSVIADLAAREIGVMEHPRGSNRGPRVDEYQAATWLKKKDWGPWCASFVCFIVREAMHEAGGKYTFRRPRTAGAFDLARWSRQQDLSTQTRDTPGRDIARGDIVIFSFSHVGFAMGPPDKSGHVICVEGNTDPKGGREGYGVFQRRRSISSIITRIRFTV